MFNKNLSNKNIFETYLLPNIEKFKLAFNDYVNLAKYTEREMRDIYYIYFKHDCQFSKWFFLNFLEWQIKKSNEIQDFLDEMIFFSSYYLDNQEACYGKFKEELLLFMINEKGEGKGYKFADTEEMEHQLAKESDRVCYALQN